MAFPRVNHHNLIRLDIYITRPLVRTITQFYVSNGVVITFTESNK